jgi:OOP family OmpA-OmpF porin
MNSHRILTLLIAASALLVSACGGATQFSSASAVAINGTPPPPPPPPPPKVEEPPPPPPRVELRDNKIEFKEKIQFELNKAIIREESFSLLHDIAEVIKKNPHVKRISIEGHASAEGDARRNKTLSDERAKSVMAHLVKKEGLEAARLVAKGWGIEKPIAGNDSEEGREKNRRVEFLVIEQDVTAKKVEIDPATGKERVVGEETKTLTTEPSPAPGTEKPAGGPAGAAPKKGENPKKPEGAK